MKKKILISITLLLILNACSQDKAYLNSYVKESFFSDVLNETRDLMVYFPDGYNSAQNYSVLYVLDGEYLFEYAVSMTKFLYECDLIPRLIVIGIKNEDRERDFLPTFNFKIPKSGGAENFAKCLIDELVPYVNLKYKTSGYNILFGHSFGGLFTEYIFTSYGSLFNSYIAASPSVYWDNHFVPTKINENQIKLNNKVYNYFTMGSYEREQMVNGTLMLDSVLKNKLLPNLEFKYEYLEGEDHATTRLKTLNNGLEYIFKKWRYPFNSNRSNWNVDSLNAYYDNLSEQIGVKIYPLESGFYYIGYYNLQQGKNDEAFRAFEEANKNYPESPKSYTNLATAYERTGNKEKALKFYEMALEKTDKTDPLYKNIQQKIEKIEKEGVSNSCPL